jgi:phenylpyruvate tautomerase PptA (4-oxalocrotonate tautomerase family)
LNQGSIAASAKFPSN